MVGPDGADVPRLSASEGPLRTTEELCAFPGCWSDSQRPGRRHRGRMKLLREAGGLQAPQNPQGLALGYSGGRVPPQPAKLSLHVWPWGPAQLPSWTQRHPCCAA